VPIRNSLVQTYLFLYDSCTCFTTKEPAHAPDKCRIYCNSMAFSFVNTAWDYVHIQRPFAVIKILFSCEIRSSRDRDGEE